MIFHGAPQAFNFLHICVGFCLFPTSHHSRSVGALGYRKIITRAEAEPLKRSTINIERVEDGQTAEIAFAFPNSQVSASSFNILNPIHDNWIESEGIVCAAMCGGNLSAFRAPIDGQLLTPIHFLCAFQPQSRRERAAFNGWFLFIKISKRSICLTVCRSSHSPLMDIFICCCAARRSVREKKFLLTLSSASPTASPAIEQI
jgi:hypothetical protein